MLLSRPGSRPDRDRKIDGLKIKVIAWIRQGLQYLRSIRVQFRLSPESYPAYLEVRFTVEHINGDVSNIVNAIIVKLADHNSRIGQPANRVFTILFLTPGFKFTDIRCFAMTGDVANRFSI